LLRGLVISFVGRKELKLKKVLKMKKYKLLSLIVVILVLIFSSQVQANLSSTFDTGAQGWTGDDPTNHDWNTTNTGAGWQGSGGNPGGFLEGVEIYAAGGTGYFMAPNSWLGNWSQYKGGTLQYDIKIISGTSYFSDSDVRIYNGSSYLACTVTNGYWSGWQTFELNLTPAIFGVSDSFFDGIMSNVTAFWIRGEYISGPEAEGLDNVKLNAPVPIPGAVWLFGSGLLGLTGWRRFRKG
jgi:hypothetical protein